MVGHLSWVQAVNKFTLQLVPKGHPHPFAHGIPLVIKDVGCFVFVGERVQSYRSDHIGIVTATDAKARTAVVAMPSGWDGDPTADWAMHENDGRLRIF